MRASAVLIWVVGGLCLFGMVMLYSTSGPQGEKLFGDPNYFTQRQMLWLLAGLAAATFGARMDYRRWLKLAWPIFGVTLVLLALVYVPGIGRNIKGSHRWIRLPAGLTFQPSELAKFATICLMASWYGTRRRQRAGFKGGLLIPGLLLASMLGLIVFETDFGATILIGATGGGMMFVAGAPIVYLLGTGVLGGAGLAWMISQNRQRMGRIMAFMDPEKYAQDEAYQLLNAIYAFVAGGIGGVGLGQSLQKQHYLPEAHTDFIFAIIGEELGIPGSLGVALLFVAFFFCGLRISGRAADPGGRLMAFGITLLVSLQATLNIAVVTGCLPTKGLPLPFISFGGTSLVVVLFMVGVLVNIAHQGADRPVTRRRRKAAA
ncbi:MAG: putative lipid II flippase FtsW [Kiritimatiellae bacterium]|nr:putative lipid II flippase FtsW [Kiritimatiellia bacterium]MDD4341232.1 putative lipid II flippase FtsW [Kiritimatiellia bacterium]